MLYNANRQQGTGPARYTTRPLQGAEQRKGKNHMLTTSKTAVRLTVRCYGIDKETRGYFVNGLPQYAPQFAITENVEGKKGWTITHVETGAGYNGLTYSTRKAALAALETSAATKTEKEWLEMAARVLHKLGLLPGMRTLTRFMVSFRYSGDVFCTNMVTAESSAHIRTVYAAKGYTDITIRKAEDCEVQEALRKGMPSIKVYWEEAQLAALNEKPAAQPAAAGPVEETPAQAEETPAPVEEKAVAPVEDTAAVEETAAPADPAPVEETPAAVEEVPAPVATADPIAAALALPARHRRMERLHGEKPAPVAETLPETPTDIKPGARNDSFAGTAITGKGYTITFDKQEARTLIKFDQKPAAAVLALLKQEGFFWSRTRSAWVKGLNMKAYRAALRINAALAA